MQRREFVQSSVIASLSVGCVSWLRDILVASDDVEVKDDRYSLRRDVPTKFYDGRTCRVHARAGIVPGVGKGGGLRVVLTMNTLDVSGSDVFKAVLSMQTDDLGENWTKPTEQATLAPRRITIDGQERPWALSDCWPTWHAASKTLLGTGHDVVYTPEWKVPKSRPRKPTYSTYNPTTSEWATWKTTTLPGEQFQDAGPGCVQRYDEEDGSILLPIYFRPPGKNSCITVTRCKFDGKELTYTERGNILSVDDMTRGLHEPSLTKFAGEYFLTIRNDERGYVTRSKDGLTYEPIQAWRFDDGSDLGNYNTQQHWVTHSDALFLVYTRKGANNDHVFRHRAPLFMAQVDPKTLRVIRSTEQILVPERGARLGNFGVTQISPHETWVTVTEWMQTWGPNVILPVDNKYGSDGSLWIARLRWKHENKSFHT